MKQLKIGTKGQPKTPGAGRKKGTPNKTTQLLKDAVLKAAEVQGERGDPKNKKNTGLEKYLVFLAKDYPVAFTGLLNKVLPMQIGGASDEGDGITINVVFSDKGKGT